MTFQDWQPQWTRLAHFHVSGEADRNQLEAEWFAQLKHHHIDAVDAGITQLIGSAKDNFLPGLGLLKDFIQARIGRYDRTPGKCADCGGSGWVDVEMFSSNKLIYANTVKRCLSCGIPEPKAETTSRRERVTDLQAHEYRAGRFGRDQMPEWAKAKHPDQPGNPELRKMIVEFKKRFVGEGVA